MREDNDDYDSESIRRFVNNPHTDFLRRRASETRDMTHARLIAACKDSSDPQVRAEYHRWHATCEYYQVLTGAGDFNAGI